MDKLQFISNQTKDITHLGSIQTALDAGCRWIQLRVKDQSFEDVLKLAEKAKTFCDSYQAKLIINDFPFIAKEINAYGLHLGLNDMPIEFARKIVGEKMIIGGTANTLEHVVNQIKEGADYIGLGPFRFTSTKQNLSPILGLEGYRNITASLKELVLSIPMFAIGGITQEDIQEISETGMYGVAISGSIINAKNPGNVVYKIKKILC
ncbi:thiamine phosphate synthase [Dyadobacter frigoris]|uniref:Thiamine-phosphate synthase n=1 Tax=Dyadobacter frigoris TaxID=2576211 RepID=A0A4U6D3X4_9BACT|nr:thiamine phosphate synthase [Dyadobacter frigoris]